MMLANYAAGWRSLHEAAPRIPANRLLLRILAWKLCRMTGLRPIVRLHQGCRMRLDAVRRDQGIRTAIFLLREAYEPSVRSAIDRFVKPGAICYDIGANLGLWSLRMAEKAGSAGRVVAFEALPSTAALLARNVALSALDNLEIVPVALGAEARMAAFYAAPDIGRSGLAPDAMGMRPVEVPMRRLDDLWTEQGRPEVSFVKMDVEGAEPLVLQGGAEFFAAVRPITCCELNPPKLRQMGFAPAWLLERFAGWGYDAFIAHGDDGALTPYAADDQTEAVEDLVLIPRR